MNVAEKIGSVTSELKAKANQARSEKLEQSNEELKRENTLLRQQLKEDGASRDRMLALLDRMKTTPRKRKRGGWVRTLVVAGAAYVLGARAGRERYEQIRRSWSRMLNRTPAGDVIDRVRDGGQAAMEQVGSVAQTVKEQIGSGSHTAKDQKDETGKD
jgi:FtsZ-binding cell division protein ZapB